MGKLKTEIDTVEMGVRVGLAFSAWSSTEEDDSTPFFEHGQWWIEDKNGAQWSVVDAIGGDAVDGFSFEKVTEGEDDE